MVSATVEDHEGGVAHSGQQTSCAEPRPAIAGAVHQLMRYRGAKYRIAIPEQNGRGADFGKTRLLRRRRAQRHRMEVGNLMQIQICGGSE